MPEEAAAQGVNPSQDPRVASYIALRQGLGVLGVALPVLLPVVVWLFGTSAVLQNTISEYYDTVGVGVLVGTLAAIGVFLISYKGVPKEKKDTWLLSDNLWAFLAGLGAIGVALFPTTSDSNPVRVLHVVSALVLLGALAFFSLVLFRKGSGNPRLFGISRNHWYAVSGVIILICIGSIAVYWLFIQTTDLDNTYHPAFWLESIALWAFGLAWLAKGRGLHQLRLLGRDIRERLGGSGVQDEAQSAKP